MAEVPKAGSVGGWLVCGSPMWANKVHQSEGTADYAVSNRKDGSIKLPLIVAPLEPSAHLKDSDVYALIGHAELLSDRGEVDMPLYFIDLAMRIAQATCNDDLAQRCADRRLTIPR